MSGQDFEALDPSLTQRLLPELQNVAALFRDVTIICYQGLDHQDPIPVYRTNTLMLAALSSMLADALEDISTDDDITILVPEGISHQDLEVFFRSLFDWSFVGNVSSRSSIEQVLDLFSISYFNFEDKIASQDISTETTEPQNVTIEKSHKCPECDASFSTVKLQKRHSRIVHSENHPHVCGLCGRRCRGPAELVVHQRCHSKEKPFSCDCGKSFAQKSQLNDHMYKVHFLKQNGTNVCEICGLALASSRAVKSHMKIHARPESKEDMSAVEINESETEENEEMDEEPNSKENIENKNFNEEKPKNLICSEPNCGKSFKSRTSLKQHSLSHASDSKNLSCSECGKSFSQQSHLNVHIKILHEGAKPFMCSFCGRQFAVKSNLKKHLRMHERKRIEEMEEEESGISIRAENLPFEIELKSVIAIESQTLNRLDPILESSSSRLVCEFCGRAFDNENEMRTHARTHEKRPFVCELCDITFESWSARRIHQREHTGGEQFICETCNLACISKSSLAKHQLIHTGQRPHTCNVANCGKSFVQKSQLNYHLKVVHGPPVGSRARDHPCLKCGSSFTTSSTLKKHQRTHLNDRPYECSECGKRFIQKTHLVTHSLRHSGDRPFSCPDCSKTFVTSSNLSEHLKTHNGGKKVFACTESGCDSKYASSFDLKVHNRKHTGETPFVCFYCNRSFRSKRLLDEHTRIHTGVLPFFCSNCSKTFTTASGLRQHFRRHDTCRLASTRGSFSLTNSSNFEDQTKTANHLILQDNDESALLADSILAT